MKTERWGMKRTEIECYFCGEDCSHAYATWKGYPCHIMCLPVKRRVRICRECGVYPADPPEEICVGCAAYKEHTAVP